MGKVTGLKDTIDWYNNNSRSYADNGRNLQFIEGIEKFSSLVPPIANVLDAGCGSGRDSALLKDRGLSVTGLDISTGMISEARSEHPDINFIEGDLLNLPFSENNFEGIWAHASLVHFEEARDTQKALNEFYRVLKPGGIVHLFVKEQSGDKKTDVVSDVLSHHDRFFRYYTKDELLGMLNIAGLEIFFVRNQIPDPAGRVDTHWIWIIAKKRE